MSDKLPVITMCPPWANWVAAGWKIIETRTHDRLKSLVGRRIGIHVALKWDESAFDAAKPYLEESRLAHSREYLRVGGAIICTAHAYAHMPLDESHSQFALIDCATTKRYGLFLGDVQHIECIPCRGKQGIWYYDGPIVPPLGAALR